jgi:omega-hydroxy-beta-dihydromenaquinone-9 sulfotransferase
MYFNWRQFLTDSIHALFPSRDPHLRITGHRARVLVVYFLCMAWMGGSGRLGMFADRIFFRKALRTPVKAPLFIIGNFRSGSTLLHRLLAADPQFTAMKTWEIYFAPSVTQRKFWHGFFIVDRFVGSPIMNRIRRQADTTFGDVQMHRVNLTEPEEDEALLMYLWDSLFNWFFMPYQVQSNPYWQFDTALPRWRRRKVMAFYRSCLQRHLYAHPGNATYISKNPSFSAKLGSLLEEFPDARIIYLARHPADTLVSTIGWFSFAWGYFSSLAEKYPYRETIMEMTRQWYLRPVAILDRLPERQYRIVRYEELVDAPQKTVTELLEHFGFVPGLETCRQLDDLENGPPVHKSHSIELNHVGLDPGQIASFYAEVLERFGYEE